MDNLMTRLYFIQGCKNEIYIKNKKGWQNLGFVHGSQNKNIEDIVKKGFLKYSKNNLNKINNIEQFLFTTIYGRMNKLIDIFERYIKNEENKIITTLNNMIDKIGNGIQDCFFDVKNQINDKFMNLSDKLDNIVKFSNKPNRDNIKQPCKKGNVKKLQNILNIVDIIDHVIKVLVNVLY